MWKTIEGPFAPMVGVALVIVGSLAGCGQSTTPAVASLSPGQVRSGSTAHSAAEDLKTYVAGMQKWVDCMRQHGIPKMPDPQADGQVVTRRGVMPNDPQVRDTANRACESVRPTRPQSVTALWNKEARESVTPAEVAQYKKLAKCMQANGAPDFPSEYLSNKKWDQDAPGALRATSICDAKLHPGVKGVG